MSNPTYARLTGWVTKDPELRRTNGDQTPVCTIRMGTASRWLDRSSGEWKEGAASYFDVVCWRALAVNASASLRKGHMVTVHGTFRTKTWTDRDNKPRTQIEITASSIGHELLYGWTHFNRIPRGSAQGGSKLAAGEASRGLDSGTDFGFSRDSGYGGDSSFGDDSGFGGDSGFNDDQGFSRDSGLGRDSGFGQGAGLGRDAGFGQGERSPFDDAYQSADGNPAIRPAQEPDDGQGRAPGDEAVGERMSGTGDEGVADDAGTSEAAASDPRLEGVAVPV